MSYLSYMTLEGFLSKSAQSDSSYNVDTSLFEPWDFWMHPAYGNGEDTVTAELRNALRS